MPLGDWSLFSGGSTPKVGGPASGKSPPAAASTSQPAAAVSKLEPPGDAGRDHQPSAKPDDDNTHAPETAKPGPAVTKPGPVSSGNDQVPASSADADGGKDYGVGPSAADAIPKQDPNGVTVVSIPAQDGYQAGLWTEGDPSAKIVPEDVVVEYRPTPEILDPFDPFIFMGDHTTGMMPNPADVEAAQELADALEYYEYLIADGWAVGEEYTPEPSIPPELVREIFDLHALRTDLLAGVADITAEYDYSYPAFDDWSRYAVDHTDPDKPPPNPADDERDIAFLEMIEWAIETAEVAEYVGEYTFPDSDELLVDVYPSLATEHPDGMVDVLTTADLMPDDGSSFLERFVPIIVGGTAGTLAGGAIRQTQLLQDTPALVQWGADVLTTAGVSTLTTGPVQDWQNEMFGTEYEPNPDLTAAEDYAARVLATAISSQSAYAAGATAMELFGSMVAEVAPDLAALAGGPWANLAKVAGAVTLATPASSLVYDYATNNWDNSSVAWVGENILGMSPPGPDELPPEDQVYQEFGPDYLVVLDRVLGDIPLPGSDLLPLPEPVAPDTGDLLLAELGTPPSDAEVVTVSDMVDGVSATEPPRLVTEEMLRAMMEEAPVADQPEPSTTPVASTPPLVTETVPEEGSDVTSTSAASAPVRPDELVLADAGDDVDVPSTDPVQFPGGVVRAGVLDDEGSDDEPLVAVAHPDGVIEVAAVSEAPALPTDPAWYKALAAYLGDDHWFVGFLDECLYVLEGGATHCAQAAGQVCADVWSSFPSLKEFCGINQIPPVEIAYEHEPGPVAPEIAALFRLPMADAAAAEAELVDFTTEEDEQLHV